MRKDGTFTAMAEGLSSRGATGRLWSVARGRVNILVSWRTTSIGVRHGGAGALHEGGGATGVGGEGGPGDGGSSGEAEGPGSFAGRESGGGLMGAHQYRGVQRVGGETA